MTTPLKPKLEGGSGVFLYSESHNAWKRCCGLPAFPSPAASSAGPSRFLAGVTMLNICDEVLEKLGSGFSH